MTTKVLGIGATAPRAYVHAIGARVRVAVDDDRGFGWYAATVVGHTTIGDAVQPGGWPTYKVQTDDGRTYDYASPECVRAARKGRAS